MPLKGYTNITHEQIEDDVGKPIRKIPFKMCTSGRWNFHDK